MNYFVESSSVGEAGAFSFNGRQIKEANRLLFNSFNFKRPDGHAASLIVRDEEGVPYAVKCNCKKGVYHPVLRKNGISSVLWEIEIKMKFTDHGILKDKIKRVLARKE